MISLQDVEYTDFIYWQETENFINGVASATGNIELFFDEKVDRDSSLVLYDGKEIDLNNNEGTYTKIIDKKRLSGSIYSLYYFRSNASGKYAPFPRGYS